MTTTINITAATLDKAAEIYADWFCDDMELEASVREQLIDCVLWVDFEDLQQEMSAGQWDAVEAAVLDLN